MGLNFPNIPARRNKPCFHRSYEMSVLVPVSVLSKLIPLSSLTGLDLNFKKICNFMV